MQWEYNHKYLPICLVTHKTLPSNHAGVIFVTYTKKHTNRLVDKHRTS